VRQLKKIPTTQLPQPTEEGWKIKAEEFYSLRPFPICPGPTDGKHNEVEVPHKNGSLFFIHKILYFLVLLALVYANPKFNTTDVGRHGESNYGGLFNKISFWKIFLTTV